jgi:CheY-like chemotaxis protein
MPTLEKILYVDDEEDIRTVVEISLEMAGIYTIKLCDSGLQALQEAPQFAPHLILLDVMMPVMDGPTTLDKLREIPELSQVPVIFMTAKAQPHELAELKALGAVAVLTKPFDPMTLATQVQSIWDSL